MTTTFNISQDLKLQDILNCDTFPLALSLVNSRVSKNSLRKLDFTPRGFKIDDMSME